MRHTTTVPQAALLRAEEEKTYFTNNHFITIKSRNTSKGKSIKTDHLAQSSLRLKHFEMLWAKGKKEGEPQKLKDIEGSEFLEKISLPSEYIKNKEI